MGVPQEKWPHCWGQIQEVDEMVGDVRKGYARRSASGNDDSGIDAENRTE